MPCLNVVVHSTQKTIVVSAVVNKSSDVCSPGRILGLLDKPFGADLLCDQIRPEAPGGRISHILPDLFEITFHHLHSFSVITNPPQLARVWGCGWWIKGHSVARRAQFVTEKKPVRQLSASTKTKYTVRPGFTQQQKKISDYLKLGIRIGYMCLLSLTPKTGYLDHTVSYAVIYVRT